MSNEKVIATLLDTKLDQYNKQNNTTLTRVEFLNKIAASFLNGTFANYVGSYAKVFNPIV
jgi:hypothetical protein